MIRQSILYAYNAEPVATVCDIQGDSTNHPSLSHNNTQQLCHINNTTYCIGSSLATNL